MAEMKPLPIGVEDFKRLVERGYSFVDKTLMIKNLLDKDTMVSLFTRPRRFGKTLNKTWYDGYLFGRTEIYNPWSILNYISSANSKEIFACQPYWINTSSNSIIHELVVNSDAKTREKIASLMEGGSIKAPIYEDSVYANLNVNSDRIWSFLLFTGYLKQIDSELQGNKIYSTMVITNREVQSIYELTIQQWFEETVKKEKKPPLLQAVLDEDPQAV